MRTPTRYTITNTLESETVRLFGWVRVENWDEAASAVRGQLFGEMVKRAIPVVEHHHSDLFHDAKFVDQLNGPAGFWWMVRESGTDLGELAVIQEQISSSSPRVLYWVELHTSNRGLWLATFTEYVRVQRPDEPA